MYLSNDMGKRRDLVHFIPPKREGGEAMFVFPRLDDQGEPLLTPASKSLTFNIGTNVFEKRSIPLKKFRFDVGKMVHNGAVVF